MREIKDLSLYLIGLACLFVGIWALAGLALDSYRPLLPSDEDVDMTTGSAGESAPPNTVSNAENPFRKPVWIEPTKKYVYNPASVVTVRPDPPKPAATQRRPRPQNAKPARPRHNIGHDAREAYGSAGKAQQLLILPLQHQAPN